MTADNAPTEISTFNVPKKENNCMFSIEEKPVYHHFHTDPYNNFQELMERMEKQFSSGETLKGNLVVQQIKGLFGNS